jgi:hypothetical protein
MLKISLFRSLALFSKFLELGGNYWKSIGNLLKENFKHFPTIFIQNDQIFQLFQRI